MRAIPHKVIVLMGLDDGVFLALTNGLAFICWSSAAGLAIPAAVIRTVMCFWRR